MKAIISVTLGLLFGVAFLDFASQAQTGSAPVPVVAIPPPVALSPAAADLVRLAQSGLSEAVLVAYVKNSPERFDLSADAILYLRDVGISDDVVKEILGHDKPFPGQPAATPNAAMTNQFTYDQKLYATNAPQPDAFANASATTPQLLPTPTTPSPVTAPAPNYVTDAPTDVNYFYQDLSPYGTWMNLDGYGWCWQPSTVLVNREWRPYCDGGYWADTSAGWCWQSDYTWGWAPFHYGRWQHHDRAGWVWFPDRVWGPGWVTWRTESDHCGWAPLPLRAGFDVRTGLSFNGVVVGADFDFGLSAGLFTFISIGDFNRHDYARRRMSPLEVNRIYNRTAVINNQAGNGNFAAFNRGVPRERVAEVTHTRINTLEIRNAPTGRSVALSVTPGAVYRRELQPPTTAVRPVAQKVDATHPLVPQRAALPATTARPYASATYAPGAVPRGILPGAGNNNFARPQNSFNPNVRQTLIAPQPNMPATSATRGGFFPSTPMPNPSNLTGGGGGQVPVTTPFRAPPNMLSTVPAQPNNQVYYPKTYQQFNENRTARPAMPPTPAPNVAAPALSPDSVRGSQQSTPQNQPGNQGGRGRQN